MRGRLSAHLSEAKLVGEMDIGRSSRDKALGVAWDI